MKKRFLALGLVLCLIFGIVSIPKLNVVASDVDKGTVTAVGKGLSSYKPTELQNPNFDDHPDLFNTGETITKIYNALNKQLEDAGYGTRLVERNNASVDVDDRASLFGNITHFNKGGSDQAKTDALLTDICPLKMCFVKEADGIYARLVAGSWNSRPKTAAELVVSKEYVKDPSTDEVIQYYIGTPDKNWETSESTYDDYCGIVSYFEWLNPFSGPRQDNAYANSAGSADAYAYIKKMESDDPFVELNAKSAGTFYQDLSTNGGDIIIWGLEHAIREAGGASEQKMQVSIGTPDVTTGGTINPTIYSADGITGQRANGSAATDGLKFLSMKKSDTNPYVWKDVKGIYIVPAGQTTTRFAFSSLSTDAQTIGNYMDNVIFQTLAGNISAINTEDGGVKVDGYWGGNPDTTDPNSNKLELTLKGQNGKDYNVIIDMSEVTPGNDFEATIPADKINEIKTESGGIVSGDVHHKQYGTPGLGTPITLIDPVKVTFDRKGHGPKNPETQSMIPGKLAVDPATFVVGNEYDGWKFGGWFEKETDTSPFDFSKPITEDKNLVAKWTRVGGTGGRSTGGGGYVPSSTIPEKKYKVEFETPFGPKPDTQSGIKSGGTASDPVKTLKPGYTTEDGHVFEGWYLDEACTIPYDFNSAVSKDIVLYAKWETATTGNVPTETPNTPVVKVEFETEIGETPATQVEVPGNTATDPGAPMDLATLKPGTIINGYRFEGWYLDKDYTIKYNFDTPLTEDIVLYAKWASVGLAKSPKTEDAALPLGVGVASALMLVISLFALSGKRRKDVK